MKKRREAIELAKQIYFLLKRNKKEYSINQICVEMNSKYEATIICLKFLKDLELVKERKGDKKPIPERLWSLR